MAAIVAAHDEADRIGATLAALARALPGTSLWVADDGSGDATAELAREAGARVVRCDRVIGKGQAMTVAARAALEAHPGPDEDVFVLCDGDLGDSAERLGPLAGAVGEGGADMAVAVFARAVGGGFGLALGFAGWAIRRRSGLRTRAPISGQRALRRGDARGSAALRGGVRDGGGDDDRRGPRRGAGRGGGARPLPPRHGPDGRRIRPPWAPARGLRACIYGAPVGSRGQMAVTGRERGGVTLGQLGGRAQRDE